MKWTELRPGDMIIDQPSPLDVGGFVKNWLVISVMMMPIKQIIFLTKRSIFKMNVDKMSSSIDGRFVIVRKE